MADALTLSQLEIEPHRIEVTDPECEYYLQKTYWLWKVKVDGLLLTSQALPFDVYQDVLQLRTNICVPIFGDGSDFIFVRQSGKYVIWYGANDPDLYSLYSPYALWEKFWSSINCSIVRPSMLSYQLQLRHQNMC